MERPVKHSIKVSETCDNLADLGKMVEKLVNKLTGRSVKVTLMFHDGTNRALSVKGLHKIKLTENVTDKEYIEFLEKTVDNLVSKRDTSSAAFQDPEDTSKKQTGRLPEAHHHASNLSERNSREGYGD